MATHPTLLTRRDACAALNVSLSMLKVLIGRNALREIRIGRRSLIAESEISRFVGERLTEPNSSQ